MLETTADSAAPAVRDTQDRLAARLLPEGLGTAQPERDFGHAAIDARPITVVYYSCGERDSPPAVRSGQPDVRMSGFLMSNAVSAYAQYVVVGPWIQPHRRSVSSLGNPGGPAGLQNAVSPFFLHLALPPPSSRSLGTDMFLGPGTLSPSQILPSDSRCLDLTTRSRQCLELPVAQTAHS